jgi:hypothetical protein
LNVDIAPRDEGLSDALPPALLVDGPDETSAD